MALVRRDDMTHACHHPTCTREVPPKLLACAYHWRVLPERLKARIWTEYHTGQEILKNPSKEYLVVMRECIQYWSDNDGRHER